MSLFRSGNPVLNADVFASSTASADVMTVQGAVTKSLFTVLIAIAGAAFIWSRFHAGEDVTPYMGLGFMGGLVVSLVIMFRGRAGMITTPLYAAFEGLALGGISLQFEARYPGIVMQAVGLTFGTLFALLALYKARVVQATQGFRAGIFAATGAICLVYMADWILRIFGMHVPFIHETGLIGIGFSAFVVAIAALNLVLDFDLIERGAAQGASKDMEWYAAFGLLVTLVWLYLEILRLLAKLQDNNRSRRIDA